jgi:hypothetical protein
MTPAEARQIDQEEFAAECAAIRQRAYAYVERRRHEARCEIAHWLGREPPKLNVRPFKPQNLPPKTVRTRLGHAKRASPLFTLDGVSKKLTEWAAHLGLTTNALHVRANRLGGYEAAIRMGNRRHTRSITYDGVTMTSDEWASHLGISANAFHARVRNHGAESAITIGGLQQEGRRAGQSDGRTPGVVADLAAINGTGAGRHLQESPEITFHGKTIIE